MRIERRTFVKVLAASALATPLLSTIPALGASPLTFDYGPNKLDWYPARDNRPDAPVVVFAHGGAWALGNRGQVNAKPEHFTANGYHFASITYTLLPAANVQTQALQVGAAINWIHDNSARLNTDPKRIALLGHSAGCHLSSLATLTGATTHVKALICNDTRAYDIPFLARVNGGSLPFFYTPAFSSRKRWEAWSPISYTALKQHPPTLVAWSNGLGRERISKRFAAALEFYGTPVLRYDGKAHYNHISINRRIGSERGGLTQAIDQFLDSALRL